MNYIEELFKRCNIENISSFLLYETESGSISPDDYFERIKKSEEKLCEWLKEAFPDINDCNRESDCIGALIAELENIYFQIGLKAGILLTTDFYKNLISNI